MPLRFLQLENHGKYHVLLNSVQCFCEKCNIFNPLTPNDLKIMKNAMVVFCET